MKFEDLTEMEKKQVLLHNLYHKLGLHETKDLSLSIAYDRVKSGLQSSSPDPFSPPPSYDWVVSAMSEELDKHKFTSYTLTDDDCIETIITITVEELMFIPHPI